MRILILNWRDIRHPLVGGAELSLFEHAKFWQKKGAHITWISSSFPGSKSEEIIEGMKIIRHGSYYTVHLRTCFLALFKKLPKYDLVVDSFHFLPYFSPLYMRNTKIIALINEIAGTIWFKNLPLPFSLVGYLIEPFFFLFYKHIPFITASRSTYDELVHVGIPRKNISIIHHGVTIPGYSLHIKTLTTPIILFLNRISLDKGITDVIECYFLLKKVIPNVQLWIGGKEERKNILQEILQEKLGDNTEITKNIQYFGFVSEKKKFELYKKATALIHPSLKEGWGLTVIEAASQATPTVGYNVAGLKDSVITNKTGILTRKGSKALFAGVYALFRNEKKYKAISKNAYLWSKEFSWGKSTSESWDLLQKVVGSNKYAKK